MQTMEFIADVYGGDYSQFESDMNAMLSKKKDKFLLLTYRLVT